MSSAISVLADVENNYTYAGTGADITGHVLSGPGVTFFRGRDGNRRFAQPAAGECRLVVLNTSRDYSPGNTGSPIYTKWKPGIRLRIKSAAGTSGEFLLEPSGGLLLESGSDSLLLEGASAVVLWTGLINAFKHNPGPGLKSVEVLCFGMFSRLRGKIITTGLHQNIRTDEALTVVLDEAGWPASDRVLQVGNNTIDWFWGDKEDAFSLIVKICLTEGFPPYEDRNGYFVFENNTARETQTRSTISQQTFQDTTNIVTLDYFDNHDSVIKACTIIQQEREAQPVQQIWTYSGDLVLVANEIRTLTVRGNDPFLNAQVPVPYGTNEVQLLTPIITLTSGTFTLVWGGIETGSINYNATAANIQTAIDAAWGANKFVVAGGPINTLPVSIMFVGVLAEAEQELIEVRGQLNSVSSNTTIDIIRTDDGAGTYYDALVPHDTPITAGSFSLKQGSTTTPTILFSATAANIQTAWENTSQYNPGDLSGAGGPIASASVILTYTNGQISFPPSTTTVVNNTLMATRYKDVLKVERSVKGSRADFVVVAGGYSSISLSRDNGGSAELSIQANASGLTLRDLQVRAQPVEVVRTNEVTFPEVPDEVEGQIYQLDVLAEIPLAQAQTRAEVFYNTYKDPRPSLNIYTIKAVDSADAQELYLRDVSDRITAIEPHLGLSEDWIVENIRYTVVNKTMITQLGCERAA